MGSVSTMSYVHKLDAGRERQCHREVDGHWRYQERLPENLGGALVDRLCDLPHDVTGEGVKADGSGVMHYIHADDGRRCMWMPILGGWFHWDHEHPEPGPRERREYRCNRDHYADRVQDGPLPDAGRIPGDMSDDRGEFGMPTLGGGAISSIPFKGEPMAQVECPDEPLQEPTAWLFRNALVTPGGPGLRGVRTDAVTDDARFILEEVIPHLLEKFLRKNAQYARAQTGHDLGLKGIIPDINRKSAALITAAWDGPGLWAGEDTDSMVDIAEDLVGHLLLFLAKTRSM